MSRQDDSREEALRRLDGRADALEARTTRTPPDYGAKAAGMGYRLLGEMLGGVAVGLVLGIVVDGWAGTTPVATIVGTLVGFAISVWMAVSSARRMRATAEREWGPPQPLPADREDEDEGR